MASTRATSRRSSDSSTTSLNTSRTGRWPMLSNLSRRASGRPWLLGIALAALTLDIPTTVAAQRFAAPAPAQIQQVLDAAYAKYKGPGEGKNADYIPALAKVDPNVFGIALVTPEGK